MWWQHSWFILIPNVGGGVAYQGQILNVEQDITGSICEALPRLPSELSIFFVRRPNPTAPNGYRDFRINKTNILQWLNFLKRNNPFYADIDLSAAEDRFTQIETDENGSIHNGIRFMEEEEAEAIIFKSD